MKYEFIKTYSQFIVNETLTTHDIDITIKNINRELSLMKLNFTINKDDNKIILTLNNLNHILDINTTMSYLDSLFIDRHGWFPSEMELLKLSNASNILAYDEDYIKSNIEKSSKIDIVYEPKSDIEVEMSDYMYHLSIQQLKSSILKRGLIPKSKSKLSKHLDRIYLCKDINDCYKLIPKMKMYHLSKPEIDNKWIIYKINMTDLDIKGYQDPNYKGGVFVIDNIPPKNIEIVDEE